MALENCRQYHIRHNKSLCPRGSTWAETGGTAILTDAELLTRNNDQSRTVPQCYSVTGAGRKVKEQNVRRDQGIKGARAVMAS